MPNNTRMSRIDDEILRETANIIRSELKDPRVKPLTGVIRVHTTNDLAYCTIYVSVLGDAAEKKDALTGLANANGYIRRMLAERINLRKTPEIKFVLDESLEHGMRMEKLIESVIAEQGTDVE